MNAPHGQPPYAPQGRPTPAGPRPAVDAVFGPPNGLSWTRVSPRFPWHRRVSTTLGALPVALAGAFLVSRAGGALGGILWVALVIVCCALGWIVAELAYRSWGYAERPDDLLVTNGVFVKRLVVVPYGRMQFVDVTAGLLERWMGIATVRMHTAAAATDARIPCLPAAEAAQLRDRLAQKGEARGMGL